MKRFKVIALILVCLVLCSSAYAAFTSSVTKRTVHGDQRIVQGSYSSADGAGTTGGDISTGLSVVDLLILQPKGTAVATNAPVVNETFPLTSGDVTIVTDASETGNFIAYGR